MTYLKLSCCGNDCGGGGCLGCCCCCGCCRGGPGRGGGAPRAMSAAPVAATRISSAFSLQEYKVIFLYCCLDCASYPAYAIQMGQATLRVLHQVHSFLRLLIILRNTGLEQYISQKVPKSWFKCILFLNKLASNRHKKMRYHWFVSV